MDIGALQARIGPSSSIRGCVLFHHRSTQFSVMSNCRYCYHARSSRSLAFGGTIPASRQLLKVFKDQCSPDIATSGARCLFQRCSDSPSKKKTVSVFLILAYSLQPVNRNYTFSACAFPTYPINSVPVPRKITRERKDVTLPIGLADDVLKLLGGRGLSALVTTLLLRWKAQQKK